jgi:hypothetical protein
MSSSTKHFSGRGMSVDEMLTVFEKELDEIFEDKEEQFRIDIQDAGFSAEDAEECLDSQHAEKAEWRKKALADMRRFLECDGKDGASK